MSCINHHVYMKAASEKNVILWCGDCDKQAALLETKFGDDAVIGAKEFDKPKPASVRRNTRSK